MSETKRYTLFDPKTNITLVVVADGPISRGQVHQALADLYRSKPRLLERGPRSKPQRFSVRTLEGL